MTDTVERYTPDHKIPEDRYRLDIDASTARLLDRLVTDYYESLDIEANAPHSTSREFANLLREAMGAPPIPVDLSSKQYRNHRRGIPIDVVWMPERLPFEEIERRLNMFLRATYGMPPE